MVGGWYAVPPTGIGCDVRGARVVYATDTAYQSARVVQLPTGERWLELNEGVAIHSHYRPWSYLTGGYWDDFLALPSAAGRGVPGRGALLGPAPGTVRLACGHSFPPTPAGAAAP